MNYPLYIILTLLGLAFTFGICCGQDRRDDSPEQKAKNARYRNWAVLLVWAALIYMIFSAFGLI